MYKNWKSIYFYFSLVPLLWIFVVIIITTSHNKIWTNFNNDYYFIFILITFDYKVYWTCYLHANDWHNGNLNILFLYDQLIINVFFFKKEYCTSELSLFIRTAWLKFCFARIKTWITGSQIVKVLIKVLTREA